MIHSRLKSRFFLQILGVAVLISMPHMAIAKQATQALPNGFVYLADIAPTILQDIRYATPNNFTGKRLPGYQAGECILRLRVAKALLRVQSALAPTGLGLKVYDCYRPHRAVRAFVLWARNLKDRSTQNYYPRVSKDSLFKRGYIARRSTHSRGTTIDVTLVPLPAPSQPSFDPSIKRKACNDLDRPLRDNSVKMGTAFDCFDVMSHTDHGGIPMQARANRKRLRDVMKRFGFRNYRKEWWHYSYTKHSYPRTSYDFPILRRPSE